MRTKLLYIPLFFSALGLVIWVAYLLRPPFWKREYVEPNPVLDIALLWDNGLVVKGMPCEKSKDIADSVDCTISPDRPREVMISSSEFSSCKNTIHGADRCIYLYNNFINYNYFRLGWQNLQTLRSVTAGDIHFSSDAPFEKVYIRKSPVPILFGAKWGYDLISGDQIFGNACKDIIVQGRNTFLSISFCELDDKGKPYAIPLKDRALKFMKRIDASRL